MTFCKEMKTKISIGLNILLIIALGIMWFDHTFKNHYYKEFTGFVLRKSAAQIEAGNEDLVRRVLSKVKGRPTYGDLISTLEKLKTEVAEQAVAPNRSLPPSQKSPSPIRGAED